MTHKRQSIELYGPTGLLTPAQIEEAGLLWVKKHAASRLLPHARTCSGSFACFLVRGAIAADLYIGPQAQDGPPIEVFLPYCREPRFSGTIRAVVDAFAFSTGRVYLDDHDINLLNTKTCGPDLWPVLSAAKAKSVIAQTTNTDFYFLREFLRAALGSVPIITLKEEFANSSAWAGIVEAELERKGHAAESSPTFHTLLLFLGHNPRLWPYFTLDTSMSVIRRRKLISVCMKAFW